MPKEASRGGDWEQRVQGPAPFTLEKSSITIGLHYVMKKRATDSGEKAKPFDTSNQTSLVGRGPAALAPSCK